jgi:hypothetical protein
MPVQYHRRCSQRLERHVVDITVVVQYHSRCSQRLERLLVDITVVICCVKCARLADSLSLITGRG